MTAYSTQARSCIEAACQERGLNRDLAQLELDRMERLASRMVRLLENEASLETLFIFSGWRPDCGAFPPKLVTARDIALRLAEPFGECFAAFDETRVFVEAPPLAYPAKCKTAAQRQGVARRSASSASIRHAFANGVDRRSVVNGQA